MTDDDDAQGVGDWTLFVDSFGSEVSGKQSSTQFNHRFAHEM